MNVAQLKRVAIEAGEAPCPQFPRLNERGSIEASLFPGIGLLDMAFPRLNERGSIEASPT